MPALSVNLNETEFKALGDYAFARGISMEEALKDAVLELLEDQEDLASFEKAYAEYQADPKTYSHEEMKKELGLN